jgi:hypothetical protein
VEYRSGFPFNVVDEEGFLVGRQSGDIRITSISTCTWNGLNPNVVNNVFGSPKFLQYGRGQARAFGVRLRLLGRK